VAGPGTDEDAWQTLTAALRQAIATGQPAPLSIGDVLVNIGTSWWIPDYLRYVQYLQRERGVLYAPFVHDCIPLRMPETCAAGLVDDFGAWFEEAMRVADLILANSEHTARDVASLSMTRTGYAAKPHVVRLDARFDDGPQPGAAASARLDALTHARLGIRRAFALFVATVEARKNHIFVFQCWQALIERHGDAVPDLICVGKQGWLVEYTLNWLRVHPQLAQRIRLVGTLSDLDLAALYRTAEFTVYGSHYEGWGLPVTESLCYGRVPVVPNHSSLPEAGGNFAIYYEPESREGFCAAVERLMDREVRTELEGRIRARFRPRVWSDVLWQVVETVRHVPTRPRAMPVQVAPGSLYTFERRRYDAPPTAGRTPGQAMKHGLGWHDAEEWGCWSRLARAQVLLTMPDRNGLDQLYLVLRGGPRDQAIEVQAGGGNALSVALRAGQRRLVRLPLDPAPGQEVLINLVATPYSLAPFTGGGDQREIGCGLEALAVADRCDAVARLDLLDFLLDAN
jgi:glycosyltransferase involved in cell wall biosynthesis